IGSAKTPVFDGFEQKQSTPTMYFGIHFRQRGLVMIVELMFIARAAVQPVTVPVSLEACAALVPASLSAKLVADFPGMTLPSSVDAGDVRTRDIASRGDWPCPFVVAGDFDGSGTLDRALLVKSADGTIKLIGALNNNGTWQISLNDEWPLSLAESELRPMEPGLYQRNDAIDHPDSKLDQLSSIQAENSGFAGSKVNGRRAVYFLVGDQWQKLTIKDN
ncbi:MAG TPA: hypothetical protein VHL14_07715, partial [Steroidobacteraceae bacterium]|nr:hypothetical protein [Steroidobacteraceae bacterium]